LLQPQGTFPLPLSQNTIKLQIKASEIKYTMFNLIDDTRIVSFLKGYHKLQTAWHEDRAVTGGLEDMLYVQLTSQRHNELWESAIKGQKSYQ